MRIVTDTVLRRLLVALVIGIVLTGAVVCLSLASDEASIAFSGVQLPVSVLTFHTSNGNAAYHVEWAVTDEQQERGLMFRRTMRADAGMIFDFKTDGLQEFWMKNTYLPLDMIFIDGQGVVRSISADAKPQSLEIISSHEPVRYVVELNAGQISKMNLRVGDTAVTVPP